MNRIISVTLPLLLCVSLFSFPAFADEMTNQELMREIKAMKVKIEKLETSLTEKEQEMKILRPQIKGKSSINEKGLEDRVRRIEEKMEEEKENILGQWADRIQFSGALEAEANLTKTDFADPATVDTDESDIALATAELGIDANIAEHVQGHLVFLWEEDDTEPVDLDEGFITLDGKERLPLYLNAGKMYVPFGNYESHFVSDPLTLEIGETRESALKLGFVNDWIDLSVAVFNGDIAETGETDDHIDGLVSSAILTLPEGTVKGLGLTAGLSLTSNIADSDGLEGETPGVIRDHVAGLGAFLSASYMEKYFFELEYVSAMDPFQVGELSFDNGRRIKPRAWNLELAYAPMDRLELGVRYEGSDDLWDFLPEKQYGGVISYEIFESTFLALEYLHGKFENNDERDLITMQLALEF